MKIIKQILNILAITALLSSCNKNNWLPPATNMGANTLGCKINGNNYIPNKYEPSVGLYPVVGGFFIDVDGNRGVYIQAASYDSFIELYIKKVIEPGTYYLNMNTLPKPYSIRPDNYGYYAKLTHIGTDDYYTSQIYTGKIILTTIDTNTGVVAGKFEFKARNPISKDSVIITDGRFDVKR